MTYDVKRVYEATDCAGLPCINFAIDAGFTPGIAKHNVALFELKGKTLFFMGRRLKFKLRAEDVDLVRTFMIALAL